MPNTGVQVFVRVRPMLARELVFDNAVDANGNYIKLFNDEQEFTSSYDHVFPEFTSQEQVYERIRGKREGRVH